jgi:hypothetical protein
MQIAATRNAQTMLRNAAPALAEMARHRPQLSPEVAAFFRPEAPAAVPVWLPDTLMRAAVTEPMLQAPRETRVYWDEDTVGCGIPQGQGSVPIVHGLQLFFYKSGALQAQRFYDRGLLRWSVEYHPLGGRASVGFYASVERMVYLEHGLQTSYAPNGTIVSQSAWYQGTRHGWSKLWEDDGHPISATLYDRGRAVEAIGPDGSRRAS